MPARFIPPDFNPAPHEAYPSESKSSLEFNFQGLAAYNFPVSPGTGWLRGRAGCRPWESVEGPEYPQWAWLRVHSPQSAWSRALCQPACPDAPRNCNCILFSLVFAEPMPSPKEVGEGLLGVYFSPLLVWFLLVFYLTLPRVYVHSKKFRLRQIEGKNHS